MRKTFLVTVNEIGMSLRRRAFVLFAFGVPLILGIIALVVVFINRDAGGAAPAAGGGVTADQPALAAILQLLTVVLIVRLVARLFRAQHLLSGQPFSVREYYGALVGRA